MERKNGGDRWTIIGVGVALLVVLGAPIADMRGTVGELRERMARVEARLDGVETRLDGVDARLGSVETRLASIEGAVLADAEADTEGTVPESPAS